MSCWDCQFIAKGGDRFVHDFCCRHPQNKPEDDVDNVPLTLEDVDEGCALFESTKDTDDGRE